MRKNDAFVAKIVNTRLTKIFMTIFAPDERLPSSATLQLTSISEVKWSEEKMQTKCCQNYVGFWRPCPPTSLYLLNAQHRIPIILLQTDQPFPNNVILDNTHALTLSLNVNCRGQNFMHFILSNFGENCVLSRACYLNKTFQMGTIYFWATRWY